MRALTLTQPWAGLVASGIKTVENRPRSMIKREDFGKPFAIHASREVDYAVYDRIDEIAPDLDWCRPRFGSCDLRGGHAGEHWTVGCGRPASSPPSWSALGRVTSAVVAVATIERAVVEWRDGSVVDAHSCDGLVDLGDQLRWFFGPVGYVLRDVRALATPVPCRGWQGFWTLSVDVERAMVEQIGAAP